MTGVTARHPEVVKGPPLEDHAAYMEALSCGIPDITKGTALRGGAALA